MASITGSANGTVDQKDRISQLKDAIDKIANIQNDGNINLTPVTNILDTLGNPSSIKIGTSIQYNIVQYAINKTAPYELLQTLQSNYNLTLGFANSTNMARQIIRNSNYNDATKANIRVLFNIPEEPQRIQQPSNCCTIL